MSGRGRRAWALALMRELSAAEIGPLDEAATLADAGLDSLSFVELATALEEELGVDLTTLDLDGSSTVEQVLGAVERSGSRTGVTGLPTGTGRFQGFADLVGGPALRWWVSLAVEGAEHVPRSGPVVLAMNHESALDIPIAVIACPRRITFMAKRELFKNAFVSWSLRALGGFLVDRDRFDLVAVERGLEVLRRGGVLGMYPEGTRAPGRLLPFLDGAAWMALRTGATLVPCAIAGTDDGDRARRPRRADVRVAFAPAIGVEPVPDPGERRRRAQELTARMRAQIASRLPAGV